MIILKAIGIDGRTSTSSIYLSTGCANLQREVFITVFFLAKQEKNTYFTGVFYWISTKKQPDSTKAIIWHTNYSEGGCSSYVKATGMWQRIGFQKRLNKVVVNNW